MLLFIQIQKIYWKKWEILKQQTLQTFMWSVAFWKTLESNFRDQATFQLSLTGMQNESCCIMHYNQSRFENMWIKRQTTVIHELWLKEFKMESVSLDFLLNLWKAKQNSKKQWPLKNDCVACGMYGICGLRLSPNIGVRLTTENEFYLWLTVGKMPTLAVFSEEYLRPFGCGDDSCMAVQIYKLKCKEKPLE